MSSDLIVAVDGGNSKTDVALLRRGGELLSVLRGQGSSPHRLGFAHAVRVVDDLVERAWFEAGLGARNGTMAHVAAVFMAGADLPAEEAALADAVTAQGWAERNHVANDVFALLWAATAGGDGIAVTVGAGVNCVGHSRSGASAWFPALGAITGDWGGGQDIGLAALGAGVRAEDGRAPASALAGAVAKHFECATALDVAIAIHQGRIDESRLVELPPVVIAAAELGDAAAVAILHRQADEVCALISAALRQLAIEDSDIDVVLGGAVLAASGQILLDRVKKYVAHVAPHARVTLCTTRPVVGAALAGLVLAGADENAIARARAALDGSLETAPA